MCFAFGFVVKKSSNEIIKDISVNIINDFLLLCRDYEINIQSYKESAYLLSKENFNDCLCELGNSQIVRDLMGSIVMKELRNCNTVGFYWQ